VDRKVALVTGGSSGIGWETALALATHGVEVYAAARRVDKIEGLIAAAGSGATLVHALALDVTDDDSARTAVDTVLAAHGRIDILVNAAGYGSYGALEDVPLAEARHQFEVNVFGLVRMTQLVLPAMAEAAHGRIVNISSMGGRFAMMLGGWYHATKYAVEALSDALRQEVAGFGVDVVIVEPGLIATEWSGIAVGHLRATSGAGRYAALAKGFATALDYAAEHGYGTPAAKVGAVVARAALTARPRIRYRTGSGSHVLTATTALLPTRVFDAGVRLFVAKVPDLVEFLRRPR